ncbi:Fe-S cluster assembly protein SufD [Nakamurella flavida]|uniref:Fe-S cluster assembly protein SufD n=1 Tax=Nakamurella flavida TaxID=363630 RepID=A0A939C1L9_9ACTN|nr:Fe-S cluster assembly protein SufD [Nakamurella flavida]MBM9475126.1 Fe-S cluster assembly protein SufD [Nakamurella flavida]MDP9776696.1 Fe-S cluster assembly protein SufD [Nakamurella flavida]
MTTSTDDTNTLAVPAHVTTPHTEATDVVDPIDEGDAFPVDGPAPDGLTTPEGLTTVASVGPSADPAPDAGAHTHVGGVTVPVTGGAPFLHPVGSADLADHPVPSGREEMWRFTPLRRLRGLHDDAPLTGDPLTATWSAPEGVHVAELSGDEARAARGRSGYLPTDRPAARAWHEAARTLLVQVPADAQVSGPVEVTLTGQAGGEATAGWTVIEVGNHAKADIVLIQQGSTTLTDVVEIVVGDGAQVTVAALGEWAADAVHLTHHHVRLGRDATIKHVALSFGSDLSRALTSVDYAGPGGDLEFLGLYFADTGQHLEHRLFVDHTAPHCKSNVLYKGALQGKGAHTVWIGDVLIRRTAEGTDTYEMNRNLLLTEGARADSVPNLEIETGEIVGAGHASATGRFDDEQLFYLLSRGIPSDVARRLVVRGFFGEVLQKIGVPSVVERASETIERELAVGGY